MSPVKKLVQQYENSIPCNIMWMHGRFVVIHQKTSEQRNFIERINAVFFFERNFSNRHIVRYPAKFKGKENLSNFNVNFRSWIDPSIFIKKEQ